MCLQQSCLTMSVMRTHRKRPCNTSSIFAWRHSVHDAFLCCVCMGHDKATAVSLPPQFFLWANTSHYDSLVFCECKTVLTQVHRLIGIVGTLLFLQWSVRGLSVVWRWRYYPMLRKLSYYVHVEHIHKFYFKNIGHCIFKSNIFATTFTEIV
jgi:hypothetical protein